MVFCFVEELMQMGVTLPIENATVSSEIRGSHGMFSTISTRLSTPRTPSPSPEPIQLPDIPVLVKQKMSTWTILEKEAGQ